MLIKVIISELTSWSVSQRSESILLSANQEVQEGASLAGRRAGSPDPLEREGPKSRGEQQLLKLLLSVLDHTHLLVRACVRVVI